MENEQSDIVRPADQVGRVSANGDYDLHAVSGAQIEVLAQFVFAHARRQVHRQRPRCRAGLAFETLRRRTDLGQP
jgi:hypothetical protein